MSYLVVTIPSLNLFQGLGAYSISKTALLGLTKVLAIECAQVGVRVNCVAPGIIKTRFSEAVSGNFNYFVNVLPNKIMIRVIFRSWIGKFRDHHDYIFVSRTTRPKETTGCSGGELGIITSAAVTWLWTMVCSCADDALLVCSVVSVFVGFPLKKNIYCTHFMSSYWLRFWKSVKPADWD